MTTPKSLNRRRLTLGFTLVEVVIALAILAMAFFGMISVIAYSTRMNQATKERMFAMRAAEAKVEQMLACGGFDNIYPMFSQQKVGLGWDEVREAALDGNQYYALAPVNPPVVPATLPTGFTYPPATNPGSKMPSPANPAPTAPSFTYVGTPQATVFVRFPLNAGGNLTEVGTGVFMDNYTVSGGVKTFVDMDLNGKGGNAESAGAGGTLVLTEIKLLPVIIEVIWKGTAGPVSGNKGNTYLQYRYTFFRKT